MKLKDMPLEKQVKTLKIAIAGALVIMFFMMWSMIFASYVMYSTVKFPTLCLGNLFCKSGDFRLAKNILIFDPCNSSRLNIFFMYSKL